MVTKTVLWLVDLIYTLYSVFNVTIILDYMAAYVLCFCPLWPAIALMYSNRLPGTNGSKTLGDRLVTPGNAWSIMVASGIVCIIWAFCVGSA